MGIWGAKLYQDDLALDVKEEYIGKIERGLSNQKALEEIIKENEEYLEDDVEKTVFWKVNTKSKRKSVTNILDF